MKQQNEQNKQTDAPASNNGFARALAKALVKDWRANGITRNLRFKNGKRASNGK